MKGKEHMIVGTTATATMGIGFLITKTFDSAVYLVPLIIGGFIGSYMPDIDSHNSKARQVFNKVLTFSIIAIVLGYMLGIGGVVTFKNARKLVEVVKEIPMEHLLLETDCPYMAPVPHRGERNNSMYISEVIKKIAEIKSISEEEVANIALRNSHNFTNNIW